MLVRLVLRNNLFIRSHRDVSDVKPFFEKILRPRKFRNFFEQRLLFRKKKSEKTLRKWPFPGDATKVVICMHYLPISITRSNQKAVAIIPSIENPEKTRFRRVSRRKGTKWRRSNEGERRNPWAPIIGAKSIGFIPAISVRGKREEASPASPVLRQPLILNEVFLAFVRFSLTSC